MTDNTCVICGSNGANTLCSKCGNIVCTDCFDESLKMCLECYEQALDAVQRKQKMTLLGGILMIVTGLSLAAAALVAGLPVENVSILFPFLVGDVNPWTAAIYSVFFFITVATVSFIPVYLYNRAQSTSPYNLNYTISEISGQRGREFEHVEFIITTELPKKLDKTIMIETTGRGVTLRSTKDVGFLKSYTIPDGHVLEELDYDYEDSYLVLRLKLVRIP